jgi:hypothetical protein
MTAEEKSSWKIIAIPLNIPYATQTQAKVQADEIFEKYGYESLNLDFNCAIMIELFYNVLLHEHFIGRVLWEEKKTHDIKMIDDDFSKYSAKEDLMSKRFLADIHRCRPIDDNILNLILSDLFLMRDDYFVFDPVNKDIPYTAIVLLDSNGMYVGHIYTWPSSIFSKTMSVQGIRTSLYNLSCRAFGQVSEKLIQGVSEFAQSNGFNYLQIVAPTQNMVKILSKMGFVNLKPSESEELSSIETDYNILEPQFDMFKKIDLSQTHVKTLQEKCRPNWSEFQNTKYYQSINPSLREQYQHLLDQQFHVI